MVDLNVVQMENGAINVYLLFAIWDINFDIIQKKCIVEPCYEVYEEEIKREKLENIKKNIISIVLVVIIFLIIIFFCINKKSNSFNKILDKTIQYFKLDKFGY